MTAAGAAEAVLEQRQALVELLEVALELVDATAGHGLHQHIKNALKPLASVLLPGAIDAASAPALR